jgi:cellobiose-specific phosphotransferase system component IIA
MPDLIAISQGLSALKATSDIVKALIGLRDYAQILEKTVELNQQIATAQAALISAHQEQSSLFDQVHALEKEIT